jgi:hypothetical protein
MNHYKETAPLASANTFTNPPKEQELAPNCHTTIKRPPWHLRTPLQTRQGNTELAPNCHIITKPPSSIYKYLYRPAKGTESWHLTAIHLRTRNPLPSYTLCEPTATNHSHLLYPLQPVIYHLQSLKVKGSSARELTLLLRLTYGL